MLLLVVADVMEIHVITGGDVVVGSGGCHGDSCDNMIYTIRYHGSSLILRDLKKSAHTGADANADNYRHSIMGKASGYHRGQLSARYD